MRFLCVWALFAVSVNAQSPAPASALPSLEQSARQRAADWMRLADDLEGSLARMLPCDPRVTVAINEVMRASDARLATLSDYLQAATQQGLRDTDSLKMAIASNATLP